MPNPDHTTELTPLRQQSPPKSSCTKLSGILSAYSFLFLVATAILLAYFYPPLGAIYLYPSITSNWIAVLFIFLMAGLSMKTEELQRAFVSFPFNAFVQTFNFLVVSGLVYGYISLLNAFGGNGRLIQPDMANAMMICASMPITVTMVIVMVKSADGDSASAVFNAALGSLLGVFVSPGLILAYTGISGSVNLASVFIKLSLKVVLPIAVGQVLHLFSNSAMDFVHAQKKHFKAMQEYSLVYIVYCVFCRTFLNAPNSPVEISVSGVLFMAASQLLLLLVSITLAWFCLQMLFGDNPRLCITGLYGCHEKSVVVGIPLINAMFEHSPNAGLYTLPLLIWHPLQLIVGSALAPRLAKSVEGIEKGEITDAQRQNNELRASQEALARVSLVAWDDTIDVRELLGEDQRIL